MNKLKICLIALVAILVLVFIFTLLPDSSQENTLPSEVVAPTTSSDVPTDTDAATTVSGDLVETTAVQETETRTEDPNLETNVQPEGEETLPAGVESSLGVEKDAEIGSIDNIAPGNSGSASKPSKPAETTPPASSSSGSTTDPLSNNYDLTTLTYEGYMAMNGEQQKAVIGWFASPDVFVKWFNAVEAQYKAEHPEIEIGPDGSVDAGNLG